MAVQVIQRMGNQQLSSPSRPIVDFRDGRLKQVIDDMRDTMLAEGGVGIAAPQIGVSLRIIMFGFETNPRYPNESPVPFTVLINPIIEPLSAELVDGWEGCLSVPGLRGLVPRYKKIRYQGYDVNGQYIERIAENFHARVLLHECDHLDGILFPYRIKDLRFFGFEDELQSIS